MDQVDFTTWLTVGTYGGLIVSLLTTAAIAAFAWRLRRGTPRQLARAVLVCLVACCLSFAPIWWEQTRFDLLGPTLAPAEVGFWLGWAAVCAWGVPLGTFIGYLLLAAPQPATGRVAVPAALRAPLQFLGAGAHGVELRDPARSFEPLGPGRAWGLLIPLDGDTTGRPIPLTRAVTLIGRESDCDLVVDDDLASRHHAELRWERGRVTLVDRASMNGTRVNGHGVAVQAPLLAGDIMEIGDQRYRFESRASGSGAYAPLRSGTPGESSGAEDPDETRKVVGAGRTSQPSRPLVPTLRLVAANGAESGQSWDLAMPITTIGRDPAADIHLTDDSVSRVHAQVIYQASGLYAQDVGSENGTRLDGIELTGPAALHAGAVLMIGTVELRCVAIAPPAPSQSTGGVAVDPPAPLPIGAQAGGAEPAPPTVWGAPEMHHLLGPRHDQRERPHLGPPRLLPDQSPVDDSTAPSR